jgi:hypothetical protein
MRRFPQLDFSSLFCLTRFTLLRFHIPLIEPDRRISRIRLSEETHAFAHGKLRVRRSSRTRPNAP